MSAIAPRQFVEQAGSGLFVPQPVINPEEYKPGFFRLKPPQQIVFFYRRRFRFRVLVAGRRFGKTTGALAELVDAALEAPDRVCWYVAPTYRQAKNIAWKKLKRKIPRDWLRKEPNETELSLELVNGSIIELKGADNYDSLRGVGIDFLVLDEFADMDPNAWTEVLFPALADRQGRVLFIGTPKGFNHFYDLYQFALSGKDAAWHAWQFTTIQGGNVKSEEVERARLTMPIKHFNQEFRARFEAPTGRVYYAFERKHNVRDDIKDIGAEIHIGMDFNVDPMSACVSSKVADQLHTWDEIVLPNSNTAEMIDAIIARFPNRKIIVHPDPSGASRKTSAPVGQTDITLLENAGFDVWLPGGGHAPLVVDRVNNSNGMFCNAAKQRRHFIHPRCTHLIKSSEGLTYKEGTKIPDKASGLDHMGDSAGYKVWNLFPMIEQYTEQVKLLGV